MDRFLKKIQVFGPNECWEWTGSIHRDGYGKFRLDKKIQSAHRVAYTLKHGQIPDNLHVLHICDNRKCCNPKHLFLGTHQDNMNDMVHKNKHKSPRVGNGKIKLSDMDKLEIYRLFDEQQNKSVIARKFNVTPTRIRQIIGEIYGKEIKL